MLRAESNNHASYVAVIEIVSRINLTAIIEASSEHCKSTDYAVSRTIGICDIRVSNLVKRARSMKLIATDYCPFCLRCILALKEKNLEFEVVNVDLTKKATFLELLSPYARVPVLKHDGKTVHESSVIGEYLEDRYPEPALLPSDPWMRANARFWIDFCNTRFMPVYFNLLKSSVGPNRNRLRNELLDHLTFMENEGLARNRQDQPYWMGDSVSLVDITFFPFFERFADVEVYRDVVIPSGLVCLHDWLNNMRKLPSVRSISRPRDHYIEYFREFYAD